VDRREELDGVPGMNWLTVIAAAGFLFLKTGEKFATQEAAGPTLALLTAYAGEKSGLELEPHVFNEPAKAIEYYTAAKPVVGIVTPGFYLTYAKALAMEPLLEANRLKMDAERYVLVVKKSAPDDLAAYTGKTIATPLAAEERFVKAVVLQNKLGEEVRLNPVMDAEGAIFDLTEGAKNAPEAVLLEEASWNVINADADLGPQVKAIFTSDDLPRNLVVLFRDNAGKLDPTKLKDALKAMAADAAGKGILDNIRVESFTEVGAARLKKAQELFHAN
jgi:hypothetical protein